MSCEEIYRYICIFFVHCKIMFIISAVVFNEISASRRMFPEQGDGFKIQTTETAGIDSGITEHSSLWREKCYVFIDSFSLLCLTSFHHFKEKVNQDF